MRILSILITLVCGGLTVAGKVATASDPMALSRLMDGIAAAASDSARPIVPEAAEAAAPGAPGIILAASPAPQEYQFEYLADSSEEHRFMNLAEDGARHVVLVRSMRVTLPEKPAFPAPPAPCAKPDCST